MKITLGPFFGHLAEMQVADQSTVTPSDVSPLGLCIEWSTPERVTCIQIFRRRPPISKGLRLEHIVVRPSDLPVDVVCPEPHAVGTGVHAFVPLEALILTLYREGAVQRPIAEVLRELIALAPVRASVLHPAPAGLLTQSVEASGFQIVTACREGREVFAEVGWRPSVDASPIHACVWRFQIAGGLDEGTVVQPAVPGVAQLLADELHRLAPGSLRDLLSGAGHLYLTSLPQS